MSNSPALLPWAIASANSSLPYTMQAQLGRSAYGGLRCGQDWLWAQGFMGRVTPSPPWAGVEETMRNAESAGISDLESWSLVRLAMKESWLSPPSCRANLDAFTTVQNAIIVGRGAFGTHVDRTQADTAIGVSQNEQVPSGASVFQAYKQCNKVHGAYLGKGNHSQQESLACMAMQLTMEKTSGW